MSIINGAGLKAFRSQFTHGTAYAIAEIIDNSIQWKRPEVDCEINIILLERGVKGNWRLDDVIITDNGLGMSYEAIEACLNFGGGQNHGPAVDGRLGKFGLGLPYSSCSQTNEYHVYSWENKENIFTTFRDHNKFGYNDPVVAEPIDKLKSIPSFYSELLPSINSYESGTVVHWKNCDKLDVAQPKTLINHINLSLGRIYRHFIGKGVNIKYEVYRTADNKKFDKINELSRPIGIFDPMFLMNDTILPGKYGKEATNVPWGGINNSGVHEFDFIEKTNDKEIKHHFVIKYSIAKPEIQDIGGGTDLGSYYKKAIGISLVRAKRELRQSHFDFQFPNGQGDPRHRWWSVEVLFNPISDDLLNVNANKTDASNFRYISSDDYTEMESNGLVAERTRLRHELSKKIDHAIKSMFKELTDRQAGKRGNKIPCPKCKKKTFSDGKCEDQICGYTNDKCPIHGTKLINGRCLTCDKTPEIPMCILHKVALVDGKCPKCKDEVHILSKEEKEELAIILKNTYPEIKDDQEAISRTIDWYANSNKKYFIVFTDLKAPSIFINPIDFQQKFWIIEVNTRHPFYEFYMQEIIDNGIQDELDPLLLFIASWVESEVKDYSNSSILERFRASFGLSLMDIIANWNKD
jgi:hypothetical protein